MVKNKQIYYPKDDGIFKIVPTKDGLNIPLDYFGHNDYHLIMIAKRDDRGEETRINYHIRKNGGGDMIINETFYIKDKCVNEFLKNFEIKVRKIYLRYETIFKKNKHTSKHLYCTECAGANLGINLHKKSGAVEMGKLISNKLLPKEKIMKKLIKCPICDNPKHAFVYCSETDEVYIKSLMGVIPQNIYYRFGNEIALLLKPQIEIFESFIDLGIEKYNRNKHLMT